MDKILKSAGRSIAQCLDWCMDRCIAVAIWLAMLAVAMPANAHPHVFAKVKTYLIAVDGNLVALRHTWVFDQAWLDSQLLEHDKDGDGKLTPAELAPLLAESKSTLEMFKSFTVVRAGGAMIRVTNPRDLSIDYFGPVLGLSFTATLAKPAPLFGGEVLLEVYDATWFSSFEFDGVDAVAFAGEAPAGCTIKADAPASPQQLAAYRMVKKQIGPEFMQPNAPKSAAVVCGKSSGTIGANDPVSLHPPVSAR